MNFLSIFKLLQIRLPFTETVFYVPMSTFLPYPITCQLQTAPPGAPLDACVSRRACRQGRGPLQPLVRSRPADHHQQKPECLAFQKSLLLAPHPAPRHHHVPYSFGGKTWEQSRLSPLTPGFACPFPSPSHSTLPSPAASIPLEHPLCLTPVARVLSAPGAPPTPDLLLSAGVLDILTLEGPASVLSPCPSLYPFGNPTHSSV